MTKQDSIPEIHFPTVIAAAALAWVTITLIHELIGHGGMCALVGGNPQAVSTTEFRCEEIAGWQYKLVVAAGSIANILAALMGFGALRLIANPSPVLRYFLWLFISINLFHAGSYMLIGPFTGYGDWSYFIEGWNPRLLWQLLVTGIGLGLCMIGQRVAALPYWQPLIGTEPADRRARMHLLTRVALITALVTNVVAALLSPLRFQWVLPTALIAPLVILWLVNTPAWPQATNPASSVALPPRWTWIIAGIIGIILFIGVFGPGIGSFEGHPLARP